MFCHIPACLWADHVTLCPHLDTGGAEWGAEWGEGASQKPHCLPRLVVKSEMVVLRLKGRHLLLKSIVVPEHTLLLQKGEKINVAVKTCKKDCTQDNKEKFMSEAGRHPLGRGP